MRRVSRQAVQAQFGHVLAGEFEIIDFLGSGSHAEVFLARQRSVSGRRVAVKMLSTLYLSLPESDGRRAAAAMMREADLLGAMHSPCFVHIYSTGAANDGRPFIAMELAEGPTLTEVMAAKPPRHYHDIIAVFRQWAEGLAELHARGWVHRDVTPNNCVVGESILHSVRVLTYDMGTATPLTERPDRFGVGWEKDRPPGTPAYMAPEQAAGNAIDGRADQFSLASIAYEWLTGQRTQPHDVQRVAPVLEYLRSDAPLPAKPLHALRKDLPKDVAAAIHQGLHRDPAKRFADIRDFVEALATSLEGMDGPAHHSTLLSRFMARIGR